MSQKSGKIPERERQIGTRLMELRRATGWSQSKFAKRTGLTHNQLASVEYGRTPLRYSVAFQIRKEFEFSVLWLATGDGEMWWQTPMPDLKELGENKNALFSRVFDSFLARFFSAGTEEMGRDRFDLRMGLYDRAAWAEIIDDKITDWLLQIPDQALAPFQESVIKAIDSAGVACGPDKWDLVLARRKLRDEFLHLRDISPINRRNDEKTNLTEVSPKSKTQDMTEIQALIKDVKAKASQPGAKSALAKELGVAPARISEWLSGAKEPGGEYALRLENWVYGPRRKK